MIMKKYLISLMTIMMVALASISFASCSSDDGDDGSAPIPQGLIGTWYKASGASKYTISVTFNADGSGYGRATHNRILSITSWVFTYKYKSNGDVVCDATETWVSEDGDDTFKRDMTFHYNNGKLTGIDSSNGNLTGCTFEKN